MFWQWISLNSSLLNYALLKDASSTILTQRSMHPQTGPVPRLSSARTSPDRFFRFFGKWKMHLIRCQKRPQNICIHLESVIDRPLQLKGKCKLMSADQSVLPRFTRLTVGWPSVELIATCCHMIGQSSCHDQNSSVTAKYHEVTHNVDYTKQHKVTVPSPKPCNISLSGWPGMCGTCNQFDHPFC